MVGSFDLVMIQLFRLIFRLGGKIYTELTEGIRVNLREDDRRMSLCVSELRNSIHRTAGVRVINSGNSEGYKHLVCMKPRVMVAERVDLQKLDRCKDLG